MKPTTVKLLDGTNIGKFQPNILTINLRMANEIGKTETTAVFRLDQEGDGPQIVLSDIGSTTILARALMANGRARTKYDLGDIQIPGCSATLSSVSMDLTGIIDNKTNTRTYSTHMHMTTTYDIKGENADKASLENYTFRMDETMNPNKNRIYAINGTREEIYGGGQMVREIERISYTNVDPNYTGKIVQGVASDLICTKIKSYFIAPMFSVNPTSTTETFTNVVVDILADIEANRENYRRVATKYPVMLVGAPPHLNPYQIRQELLDRISVFPDSLCLKNAKIILATEEV